MYDMRTDESKFKYNNALNIQQENTAFLQTREKKILKMGCFSVTAKMFY